MDRTKRQNLVYVCSDFYTAQRMDGIIVANSEWVLCLSRNY